MKLKAEQGPIFWKVNPKEGDIDGRTESGDLIYWVRQTARGLRCVVYSETQNKIVSAIAAFTEKTYETKS